MGLEVLADSATKVHMSAVMYSVQRFKTVHNLYIDRFCVVRCPVVRSEGVEGAVFSHCQRSTRRLVRYKFRTSLRCLEQSDFLFSCGLPQYDGFMLCDSHAGTEVNPSHRCTLLGATETRAKTGLNWCRRRFFMLLAWFL